MPVTFRHLFRGQHRPVRLTQLRLGQDWEMEVRSLSLAPSMVKPIQVKIRYSGSPVSYAENNKLAPGDVSASIH